jgi:iron complex outermembrane receptor protein
VKKVHFVGASLLALAVAGPALAQNPTSPATAASTVGEIIVTATKREQTLQDVPISVAVTSQKTIERAQIRDLIDLQSVVPSLKVSQFNAASQTNFIIRGFGNGNGNDGIESSVGVFIDGVYRSLWTICRKSSASRCCAVRNRPCSARMSRPARSVS